MRPALSASLKDLRYLSARNDGSYPAAFVREIVDGRGTRAAHGPRDMPVWGAALADVPGEPVEELVKFLEAIQVTP